RTLEKAAESRAKCPLGGAFHCTIAGISCCICHEQRGNTRRSMTGRYFITRKLGAIAMSGVLGATAAMACSSGGVDSHEEATEVEPTPLQARDESPVLPTRPALEVVAEIAKSNPVLVERFMPAPELRLRRHGHRLLPQLAKDKDTPAATLGLELGGTSSQRLVLHPIENPEQFVALAPLRSRDVEAEVQADGRIVYRNAFTGTDWIVTANHNRIAHTLVLHSASAPADFRWRLEVAKGLKPVESSRNEVSWVNAQGHLRLTLREVSITSADGSISHTQLALGTDGMASLMLDPRTLS